MAIPITQADLVERIGEAEVDRFAKAGGDPAVTKRIAEAWDAFRSAALNVFTAASVDALTAATVPPEARHHIVSLAIGLLASGSNHNDFIDVAYDEAKKWLSFLAGGTVHYADDVLVRITSATGGTKARVGAPASRVFDRDDTNSGLARRHNFTR